MRKLMIIGILLLCISTIYGLKCLSCQNQRSFELCEQNGKTDTCQQNQQSCFIEVRRNQQGHQITTGCKQREACEINARENENCREPRMDSVCRWCCYSHNCYFNFFPSNNPKRRNEEQPPQLCPIIEVSEFGSMECDLTPENKVGSRCRFFCDEGYELFPAERKFSVCQSNQEWSASIPDCRLKHCLEQLSLENGKVDCTNENFVSSKCSFTCDEENNYHLYPVGQNTSVCLADQEWSNPTPCCLRECPKYAMVDLVILLDSSSSVGAKNWKVMKQFAINITKQFTLADDAAHIAVVRYNARVDQETEIRLNSHQRRAEFQRKFEKIPYNGKGTYTGSALEYVRNVIFNETNGNRLEVPDVVLVITDGTSQDNVEVVSNDLRRDGVTTFAFGIQSVHGTLNQNQLHQIAGNRERYMETLDGFDDLDNELMIALSKKLCRFQCRERFSNEP